MRTLPPLPPAVRVLTTEESDRLKREDPTLPKSPEQCVTCRGTKSFRWWNEDRTEVEDWECDCRAQWILNRFFANAGLGLTYQRYSFADLHHIQTEPLEKVLKYLDNSFQYVNSGYGLILTGRHGTGKTLLASLALKHLLAEGHDGYFTFFSSAIRMFTDGWDDKTQREWFTRRIRNTKVLVIDEIGGEHKQRVVRDKETVRVSTSIAESFIDDLLRHRVASSRPTIFTTNLTKDELHKGYGQGVLSLLAERSMFAEFNAEDYREQARQNLDREMELGLTRPVVVR